MSKYRTINLDQWHKKGEGSYSDSYVCDDESLMLKLFQKKATEETAVEDYTMAKKVESVGIVTAAVCEIVKVGSKFGVIYQNIKNKRSYSRMIADEPERVSEYARDFAVKAKELHSTPCNTELFESRAEALKKGIARAKFVGKYKKELYGIVDEMAKHTTCLHGDLHTGNLIRNEDNNYWIDFDRFSYGDPLLDIAHMYNIYVCVADHKFVQDLMHMDEELMNRFWDAFAEEYSGLKGPELEKFNESLLIYNALDLIQRNHDKPGIFSDLVTLLLVRPKVKEYFECQNTQLN